MLGHHGDHVAEPAVARAGAQFGDARMKPPGEADGEHQSRSARGRGDGKRAVEIERKRFLDKDVLVRRYRRQRLRLVLTVRRCQHHGVDIRSAQYLVIAVDQGDPSVAAEFLGAGARARRRAHETNLVAFSGNGIDQRAAPAAKSDDCGADHGRQQRELHIMSAA